MRPVGIGVLLHVSLASQVQRIQPARPKEISEAEWSEAVSGRLLHLQLVRPQVKATWWIVGIYQHVAKPENKSKRDRLLQCLANIKETAARNNYFLLITPMLHQNIEGGDVTLAAPSMPLMPLRTNGLVGWG